MKWLKNFRQQSIFAKIEYVRVDWQEVTTVEDIKHILYLMAKPNTTVIICNKEEND